MEFEDCLLLFSKIPLVNKTKTRLSKILEINDVYELSLAMLLDTLQNQSNNVSSLLIWYYAPSNQLSEANNLLDLLPEIKSQWKLEPMPEFDGLTSSSLGSFLIHAVNNIVPSDCSTCTFIASDTPHLSSQQIIQAQDLVKSCENHYDAYICPATDGGYVLLTLSVKLSKQFSHQIFENVEWSCERTCQSQITALQSSGLNVFVGPVYRDIDEIEDLIFIYQLFGSPSQSPSSSCSPLQPSSTQSPSSSDFTSFNEEQLHLIPSRTIHKLNSMYPIISQTHII